MQLAFILSKALKEWLLCVSHRYWENRDMPSLPSRSFGLGQRAGVEAEKNALCGKHRAARHHGIWGMGGPWGGPNFLPCDQRDDQTQQMIPGPLPCVWHPQGITDGTSLMEYMIGKRGNLAN